MFKTGKIRQRPRENLVEKAGKRVEELMPGKTLEDVSEMYQQFHRELAHIREFQNNDYEAVLACMDKYRDVLEIIDMFPEEGLDSWASYRDAIQFLVENDDF